MSDYLTRLVERSMGVAAQIEPLIAPLHSPSEQILLEPAGTVGPFGAVASERSGASPRENTPDDGAKGGARDDMLPRAENPPPSAATAFQEAPVELAVGRSDEPADPVRPRPQLLLREDSPPPTPATMDPASLPVASSGISHASPRPTLRPEITERPRPVTASTQFVPSPRGKRRDAVQPEIIGPRKAAALSAEPREESSANRPPAIHVTIGRVEVRAVMAPAASPKVAAPAAPKISLEEYLKQRNGGRS